MLLLRELIREYYCYNVIIIHQLFLPLLGTDLLEDSVNYNSGYDANRKLHTLCKGERF